MELSPDKAYYITVGGDFKEIIPRNGKEFHLAEVQKLVEGLIEIVYLNDKQIMVINDEGKYTKKYNVYASAIADIHHVLAVGDYICGNVVICPSGMVP